MASPRPSALSMTAAAQSVCLALGLLLSGPTQASAPDSSQQVPIYRSTTETVPLFVTVLGPDGRLVTDLAQADFEVFDNGRKQPLVLFSSEVQPISIVVMLDMSGSMSGNISLLRSAAVQMFTRLLPADKARVGNFGNRIQISPTFTNDVDSLIRTVWLDLEPGGPTPLWGAINAAMTALARVEGRRVVLVLSDGKNTGLRTVNGIPVGPTLAEMMTRAESEDFMVYAIGMRSRGGPAIGGGPGGGRGGRGMGRSGFGSTSRSGDEPDPGLQQLAFASGGGYFELTDASALGAVFGQVADELHRQYLIGFLAPEADGKVHQLEVRAADSRLKVRARRTYVAPRRP